MRKNKKLAMGLAVALMGCTLIAPVNSYAKEAGSAPVATMNATIVNPENDVDSVKGDTSFSITFATDSFEELSKEGIVSETTANAMQKFSDAKQKEFQAEFDKVLEMTEKEQLDYWNKKADTEVFKSIYEEMTEAGIITAKEKEEIQSYYDEKIDSYIKEDVKNRTDRYVSEDILSQETADKVADYLFNQRKQFSISADAGVVTSVVMASDVEVSDEKATDKKMSVVEASDITESYEVVKFNSDEDMKTALGETIMIAISSDEMLDEEGLKDCVVALPAMFSDLNELVGKGIITEEQEKAMEESDLAYFESMVKDFSFEKTSDDESVVTTRSIATKSDKKSVTK